MDISIELSLYPLAETQYKDEIWQFIDNLKRQPALKVVTNGMSTQVFGEYDTALSIVIAQMKNVHEKLGSAVFILKVIAADRDRAY